MEKISNINLSFWQAYAKVQNNFSRIVDLMKQFPKFTNDGSDHFHEVLTKVDPNKNDIWVAYITSNSDVRHIEKDDVEDYLNSYNITKTGFCENIVMYVTVTTSPNALITSHMGVSLSHEGLKKQIRGVSKDLHSFGAYVTLLQNPNRKYMVNAPVAVMGSIIASAVPKGTFFAGNDEFLPIFEKEIIDLEKKMQELPNKDKIRQDIYEDADLKQEIVNNRLDRVKKQFDNQEIDQKEYNLITELTLEPARLQSQFLVNNDGKITISEELVNKEWQKRLEVSVGLARKKPYYDLLKKNGPPIISVDGKDGKTAKNRMTIFNKSNPNESWLVIERGNPDYDWIFTEPFEPAGLTFYIAVDLQALANSGKLFY
jgi:hypothetical protein